MKTTFLFLFISTFCFSQKNKIDYITYYNYASEAEYYFHEKVYDTAIIYFELGFQFADEPHPTHHYKYAKALWKLGQKTKAVEEVGVNKGILSIDTVWFSGLKSQEYASINEKLKKNMDPSVILKKNRDFVDSLIKMDQMVRKDFDWNDIEKRQAMRIQDSLNQKAVIEFTMKYGFPAGKNVGWDQSMSTFLLHAKDKWYIENYSLLIQEVRKGNLEPFSLAQGIDRMFAVEIGENKIYPYNRYHSDGIIDPFLMFQNCVAIGVSPYYYFNHKSNPIKTIHFEYYKANKKHYNTTFMMN